VRLALIAFAAVAGFAQLPPSGTLSQNDRPVFRAEVGRVEKELAASPDNCWVLNELARTWASGQQYPETVQWLEKIASLGVGLDPSRDPLYKALHGTREFEAILRQTRESMKPVSTSREAFRIAEGDLTPESEAYDPLTRRFYLGSMRMGAIARCDRKGHCERFAEGLGSVLGVKVAGGRLWAVSNSKEASALVEFELSSGRLAHRYVAPGKGHSLNDIAIAPNGDVFATDTPGAAIWRLRAGGSMLERFLPDQEFRFANGITISGDGGTLFVSNYPDGISAVDLATGARQSLGHRKGLCLALVDGLYLHGRSLIAIQNSSMAPRIIRIDLSRDLKAVERWKVIERGNPRFNGITGGTIAGNAFYYATNIQDEKPDGAAFDPIAILKTKL
jgi:hypothetical protein